MAIIGAFTADAGSVANHPVFILDSRTNIAFSRHILNTGHRQPPLPAPQPRFELRFVPQPASDVVPAPPQRSPPSRLDLESRRPAQLDPSRFPSRHANPPNPERFERDRDRPEERRKERRWREHSGDDRLEMR